MFGLLLAGPLGLLLWVLSQRKRTGGLSEGRVTLVAKGQVPDADWHTKFIPVAESASGPEPLPEPSIPVVSEPENLQLVEGIGPKIAGVLYAAGIRTFAQVAGMDVDALKQVVKSGGVRIAFPDTWPEQAALAATGDWDGLKSLQAVLKGGRRV